MGAQGLEVYREGADKIDDWAEKEYTGLSDINDLPVLDIPYKGLSQRKGGKIKRADVVHWAEIAFRYGCGLGASHPALFRALLDNENQRARLRFLGLPVPDAVRAHIENYDFDVQVDQHAKLLEVYESEISPLPAT